MGVKARERENTSLGLVEDDAGNEVARYDEEDIYTDESAGNVSGERMKKDHGGNRNGPHPIDVRSVSHSHGLSIHVLYEFGQDEWLGRVFPHSNLGLKA
jgi:hypothetical protein